MIKIDISELEFKLEVDKTIDGIKYDVICDGFFADTFGIDGSFTMYDEEIIVVYDNFPITILVDIEFTEPVGDQHMVKVYVIDEETLLDELADILEDV